jgi:hypothetical protein
MEFNDRRLAAAKDLAHRETLEALSKKNFPKDTRKKRKTNTRNTEMDSSAERYHELRGE